MDLDPLLISRLQFAFTIIWHIVFPTFTIGLSAYIATLCVMWMRTGREHYRLLAQFWTKIFAVSFAMGVVSGLVLSYQFGTNWSRYSAVLGNVVGPRLVAERLELPTQVMRSSANRGGWSTGYCGAIFWIGRTSGATLTHKSDSGSFLCQVPDSAPKGSYDAHDAVCTENQILQYW